jgi:hypothetical protein
MTIVRVTSEFQQFITDRLEKIREAQQELVDGLQTLLAGTADEPAAPAAPGSVERATNDGSVGTGHTTQPTSTSAPATDATGSAHVFDISPAALDDYDAEQLVALRAEHRADHHDPTRCHVCDVLMRRLGSL